MQELNATVSWYSNKMGVILTSYSTLSLNLPLQTNITKYAVVISLLEQSQVSPALLTSTNHAFLLTLLERRVGAKTVYELNLTA